MIAEAAHQWSAHWGRAPLPSMEAVTSLMRAQQILLQRLNGLLRGHDLTFPRYEALMILYLSRRGALPLGKIGERLQVHATSVTNLDRRPRARRLRAARARRERPSDDARGDHRHGRKAAAAATVDLNEARFCTEPLRRTDLEAISDALRRLRAAEDGF